MFNKKCIHSQFDSSHMEAVVRTNLNLIVNFVPRKAARCTRFRFQIHR